MSWEIKLINYPRKLSKKDQWENFFKVIPGIRGWNQALRLYKIAIKWKMKTSDVNSK